MNQAGNFRASDFRLMLLGEPPARPPPNTLRDRRSTNFGATTGSCENSVPAALQPARRSRPPRRTHLGEVGCRVNTVLVQMMTGVCVGSSRLLESLRLAMIPLSASSSPRGPQCLTAD